MIKRGLNDVEFMRVLKTLKGTTSNYSDIITLLLVSGVRTHELLALKVKDLNTTSRTLTVYEAAKNSDGRVIGLPLWFISRVRGKVEGQDQNGSLLHALGYGGETDNLHTTKAMLRRAWSIVKKRAWPEGDAPLLGLHCLRHTFAVTLYKKTRDPLLVQRMLGHKSFASTQKYLVYADEDRQLLATRSLYEKEINYV